MMQHTMVIFNFQGNKLLCYNTSLSKTQWNRCDKYYRATSGWGQALVTAPTTQAKCNSEFIEEPLDELWAGVCIYSGQRQQGLQVVLTPAPTVRGPVASLGPHSDYGWIIYLTYQRGVGLSSMDRGWWSLCVWTISGASALFSKVVTS